MKPFTFTTKIWKWPGQMGWHFVHVPREYFEPIRAQFGKGMIKASVTVRPVTSASGKRVTGTTWDTSLFPHTRDRCFLVCIKAQVRKAEGLGAGDEVVVKVVIK